VRIVVVGAGLGGLSAAAHLSERGHQVTVLERDVVPGGRAGVLAKAGFKLDTGPTVLTMPDVLGATFAAAGADLADFVRLHAVDPMYRAVFADGSTLYIRRGREAMTEEIRAFSGSHDAQAFGRFSDWLEHLHRIEMSHFVDVNFDSPFDLVRSWRAFASLARQGGFDRLGKRIASYFDDTRLQMVFGSESVYAGLAPHQTLAIQTVVTHTDTQGGVFVPEGGMHSIARSLARAVERAGVRICYKSPVTRLLRGAGGSINGVEVAGSTRLVADAVVCNADLPVAYRTLLGGIDAPRVARRGRYAPSCLLWIAGVRGERPAGAAHHNLHFGGGWDNSVRAVIKQGRRMSDPPIRVTIPAADPTIAPAGCSSLYVLEPMPNLDGHIDWSKERDRIAGDLRRRIGAFGYPADDVVVERVYDPLDWEAMGLERGTPFALAHTLRQSGPFRPNNVDQRVPGLVFVGSSTRPGLGVPMVLISGKLAADRVDQYARDTAVVRW
jgi:phytoene desaturase